MAVEAVRLRYHLMPYLYTAAVLSARTGTPMMRALLVDSPDDPAAWLADLEYRLGPDLLVAPMTDPSGTRTVYLPDGEWVDWWTRAILPGRAFHTITQPLSRVPLFVRRGAVIPVTDVVDSVGERPFEAVTLLCFDVTDGRTTISDVDGDTTLTLRSEGERLLVTVDGPARIRGAVPGLPDGHVFRDVVVSPA
jgi:alpha-D-xyloside xylohydrolase